ncbi:related to cytochrome b5-Laccaria bicolor [Serendipita indica DSM 11827]|uniref:Related to cytochrome b5-Laccaria bicolor n=1 Tax=Serendipita indica (strain DSM 11827) TaxID=1109443 RepID=G4TLG9_SERID|nr:related to cytochrome b5-Laccaria bicolor [Serendipita indica DSM 11827]
MLSSELGPVLLALILAIPVGFILSTVFKSPRKIPDESEEPYSKKHSTTTPMAAFGPGSLTSPPVHLQAPRMDLFTQEELKAYDGTGPDGKIYVAVKGTVFDVSAKADMYGPGKAYNVFAGKDASKGLGLSSVKPEDAVPDYSGLDEQGMTTLNGWYDFFQKRYNIMGTVKDLPAAVSRF